MRKETSRTKDHTTPWDQIQTDDDILAVERKKASDEDAQILYAAQLYYLAEETKTDIGLTMGISRQRVDFLLKQARERNMVSITVAPSKEQRRVTGLESGLTQRYPHLQKAIVVAVPQSSTIINPVGFRPAEDEPAAYADLQLRLADAAGKYLAQSLQDDDTVLVGGGRQVLASVQAVRASESLKNLKIIPLSGFFNNHAYPSSPHGCARELQARLGGINFWLPSPAIVPAAVNASTGCIDLKTASMEYSVVCQLPLVKPTLQMSEKDATVLISNVAPVNKWALRYVFRLLYPDHDLHPIFRQFAEIWKKRRPVARIVGILLDEKGQEVPAPWQTISPPFSSLKRRVDEGLLRTVFIVSADPNRIIGLKALLRGRIVTTLITDEQTALALLDK